VSEIETGGRAFPWCGDLNETPSINLGMTLRDYFAAKAMQGLIAASHDSDGVVDYNDMAVACSAYAMADAMLHARGES
jgi:hypothetical protein